MKRELQPIINFRAHAIDNDAEMNSMKRELQRPLTRSWTPVDEDAEMNSMKRELQPQPRPPPLWAWSLGCRDELNEKRTATGNYTYPYGLPVSDAEMNSMKRELQQIVGFRDVVFWCEMQR